MGIFLGWFVLEVLHHAFFEWFNKQMAHEVGPMMHFGGAIINWAAGNPILFFVIMVSFYCLFVIVGAQITPFQWPWGMISLKEASQNLYDELITSNMSNNFKQLFVNPTESHNDVLNSL